MKSSLFLFVLGCALSIAFGVEALDCAKLNWRLSRFAKRTGDLLVVDVPPGSEREAGHARAEIDLSEFNGKCLGAEIVATGSRITRPAESWNGLKFMFSFEDAATRTRIWPNTPSRLDDFPRQTLTVSDNLPRTRMKATLTLGLQSSSGRVVFDLSTLKIAALASLFPCTNQTYRIAYPDAVRACGPQRGVMLPGGPCREDDFRTLHAWGVTLARYQMCRDWGRQNANQDLADYDRWLNGKLDHLERQVLPWARKYNIRIVVDLHVPPGGRSGSEMNMFHDTKWADHFLACWQRIATRFKGHPEIYGYDLINEPEQQLRAPDGLGYWDLQRRAAEIVRAIDPTTPIILESNGWCSAPTYAYLSPLAMDNVIYQVHMYQPFEFTHQGVHAKSADFPKFRYPDPARGWDRAYIRRCLAPVRAFQLRHHARIYVGEFSAITWAEGADQYIADCIRVFEEFGWDWTYHAFREWSGWSVEHSSPAWQKFVPSADNPRKRALLNGFRTHRTPEIH